MEIKIEDGGGTEPTLTAQQMLEKCIVPVKAEYLVRKAPATKQGSAVVTGGAETAGAQKQERGQEQSRNKSRKQMRKDVRANRQAELCTNYALGRCTYGDGCRFSHDVAEYVKSKPADLPGTCPWTAVQAKCPYGITCRYARTHGTEDDLHRTLAAVLEAAAAAAGPAAAATDGAVTAVTDGAADCAAAGNGTAPMSAPGGLEPLPLPSSIDKETNVLSKDVQALLWKNRYDFTRADGILKSMDLRISFKHQPKPLPGGRGGGGGGGGRGGGGRGGGGRGGGSGKGAVDEVAVPNGQAQPQEQPQPQQQQGQPQAQEIEQAGAQPAVEAPKAEAMGVDGKGTDGTSEGVTEGDAAAEEAEAAEAGGDLVADGPPAKRQRTDAGAATGTDAAAVAALAAEPPASDGSSAMGGTSAAAAVAAAAAAVAEARASHVEVPLRPCEKRRVDFRGKTYLAPLTTVGNLPFRRVCKRLGVDVTCGEMALATNLMQGQASEWALMKRHPCEDFFGVQVCGGYPDALARVGQLLGEQLSVDFVDINMGCPIDLVCDKNAGSALLRQPRRIEQILRATSAALGETPLTFKTRKGFNDGEDVAHTFLHKAGEWGAAAVTLHGRTRQQRYSRLADWDYIHRCGKSCNSASLQLIGNGDVFSYLDWNQHMEGTGGHLASLMIGRGALIKPWIFTEIKEQRHWDISASERLDLYKQFCAAGLEHWGSDGRGVETTRRFLLEWLSFTCRYVPVGLLEVVPQQMNHRPPVFVGRSDLETLLASDDPQDWVRISEMLLGPPPAPINFSAKHKSNSYAAGATSELDMARG